MLPPSLMTVKSGFIAFAVAATGGDAGRYRRGESAWPSALPCVSGHQYFQLLLHEIQTLRVIPQAIF